MHCLLLTDVQCEEDVFKKLGLRYINPISREGLNAVIPLTKHPDSEL